jgi:hypothetical protein
MNCDWLKGTCTWQVHESRIASNATETLFIGFTQPQFGSNNLPKEGTVVAFFDSMDKSTKYKKASSNRLFIILGMKVKCWFWEAKGFFWELRVTNLLNNLGGGCMGRGVVSFLCKIWPGKGNGKSVQGLMRQDHSLQRVSIGNDFCAWRVVLSQNIF